MNDPAGPPTRGLTSQPTESRLPALSVRDRFTALFGLPYVPQCTVDADGTVVDANDAFARLLGRPATDVRGRHLREFNHPDDDGQADAFLASVLAGDKHSGRVERLMQGPEGQAVPVRVDVAALPSVNGRPAGATAVLQDISAVRDSERRRAQQEEFFAALSARANDLALVGDAEGRIVYVSPAVVHVFEYRVEDLVGAEGWDFIHPDDVERYRGEYADLVEKGGTGVFTFRVRVPDGSWRWVEESATNLLHSAVGGIVCNLRDITERVDAEQALRASEARHRAIADTAQEGICVVSTEGRTLYANGRMAEILGLEIDELYAVDPARLLDAEQASDALERRRRPTSSGDERYEVTYRHPDGGLRRLLIAASPLLTSDGSVEASLKMVSDVTEARRVEEELRRAALHDALTGLPNRALAINRLEHALTREGARTAVLFIDLDHFKLINDSRGHRTGDSVLVAVADRLREAARPHDTVARFGGDEFIVVCEVVDEQQPQEIAAELLAALAGRFDIDGTRVDVRASIGVAVSPPQGADDLLRYADTAMYSAKSAGRGRVRLFDQALAEQAEERYALAADLRVALEQDELSQHYQPIVELSSGRVVGMEALARWTHPQHGPIGPDRFLAVAELTGLAPDLDRWAIRQALRGTSELRAARAVPAGSYVAVNLSARNLGDLALEEELIAAATKAGIAPQHVVLEVTETAIMEDRDVAVALLTRLRERGFLVAVDDFGTGYSSLAYLRNLPITSLKIDRSFVSGIADDRDSLAIVASIVDLAGSIGVTVIAEGVETHEQAALLRDLGCTTGQGWLWAAAMPAHDIARTSTWTSGFPIAQIKPRVPRSPDVVAAVGDEHGRVRLFELHAQGASLATIASALNQEGFRTPAGIRWHRTTVARAIADAAYPSLRSG